MKRGFKYSTNAGYTRLGDSADTTIVNNVMIVECLEKGRQGSEDRDLYHSKYREYLFQSV